MLNICQAAMHDKKSTILLMVLTIISTDVQAIETVTVTASRTPVNVTESGSAVTILDRKFIRDSNLTSVAELLRSVPGLHVNQQGARGALTQVRVRGAEANQVLVLIDGVEANDPAQGGEFNFAHLMASQIERIEVVRGPQSALWGSDALAGVINIITVGTSSKPRQIDLLAEAGSFSSSRSSVAIRLAGSRGRLQLAVNHFDTGGTNIARQGAEEDGYENTTVSLNASAPIGNAATAFAMLRQTDARNDFDGIDFINSGLPVDAFNETDSDQQYAKLGLSLRSFGGQLMQRLSFRNTDTDNENDSGGAVNDITRGTKRQTQYQADLFLGKQTLSVVAEYEDIAYQQRGLASPFGNPNKNHSLNNKSIAVEYRLELDRWNFSASTRQDDNSAFENVTPYRLTGNWHTAVADLDLYGSLGRAFKNPTFTERFGFFDNFIGNPDLSPETSTSVELGLRKYTEGFSGSLAVFRSALTDEINGFVFDAATGGFTAANRDGDSDRQGIEAQLSWSISEQLRMNASYTYIDATFEDAIGRDIDEVRRPHQVASLDVSYRFGKASLYLSVNHDGSQQDDFFPPFPPFQERVELDSYTIVNFAGSYQLTENIQLIGRFENLLDDQYEEVVGFRSPGFAAYAGVRLSW